MGYIVFPQPRLARFSPSALTPLLKMDLHGSVQLFSIREGFDLFRAYLLEYQKKAHDQPKPKFWTDKDAADHRIRALCHLVLTLPEFQLD